MCNDSVPSSIRQECDEFVDQFTPQIIKLLEEQLQPETLCGELALCSFSRKKFHPKLQVKFYFIKF